MVAKKRPSKRTSLQQKYKIQKRTKEHHKRVKKGKILNLTNRKKKVIDQIEKKNRKDDKKMSNVVDLRGSGSEVVFACVPCKLPWSECRTCEYLRMDQGYCLTRCS